MLYPNFTFQARVGRVGLPKAFGQQILRLCMRRVGAAKSVTTYPYLVQSGYWWQLTVAFSLGFIAGAGCIIWLLLF